MWCSDVASSAQPLPVVKSIATDNWISSPAVRPSKDDYICVSITIIMCTARLLVSVCVCGRVRALCVGRCQLVCKCKHKYVHTCACAYVHVYINICIYICICIYMFAFIQVATDLRHTVYRSTKACINWHFGMHIDALMTHKTLTYTHSSIFERALRKAQPPAHSNFCKTI